jgi:lysophospholipid acyltransferase (LPLAT)-like uncharacterized protein
MLKRPIFNGIAEWIAPRLIIAIMWACSRTTRPVVINWHVVEGLERRGTHGIIAAWHNHTLYFAAFLGKRLGMHTIMSKSRDGDAIALIARAFGMPAIRGSTSSSALSVLRQSLRLLRQAHVGITPDGPRGPRYVAQRGAAALAQLSGAPIVPMAWAADRQWEFGSWDRMKLPKPFARIAVIVGEPIWVARDEDSEAARLRIERTLRHLTRDADRFVGGTLTEREPLLREIEPGH